MTISINHTTDIEKIAETIARAFQEIPFNVYLFNSNSYKVNLSYYIKRIGEFVESGAIILEANDHQAVAIFVPPTVKYPQSVPQKDNVRAIEIRKKFEEHQEKNPIRNKNNWSLAFLAKHPDFQNEKGLVSALLRPYLDKIKEERGVVTLKAIDTRPKEIYEHYGFRIINSPIRFGDNGEFKVYSMVYNG